MPVTAGEHSREILAELGYGRAEIEGFVAGEIVVAAARDAGVGFGRRAGAGGDGPHGLKDAERMPTRGRNGATGHGPSERAKRRPRRDVHRISAP